MKIKVKDKIYDVETAETPDEMAIGLTNTDSLESDEGMLFIFDDPQTVSFHMKGMKFPIDIVFIDEDLKVISIYEGKVGTKEVVEEDNVNYVLEVNINSDIKEGDELDFVEDEEDEFVMKVIAPDGSTQMELKGGERIFSRANTKTLIKQAKKAYLTKTGSDYKRLGKTMFKYLRIQNDNPIEYVNND